MRNRGQRGFSLITAIFLLVMLASLGAAMVTFSTSQRQTQTLDVLGSRAYQAASAGIEWAAYNIEIASSVALAPTVVFSQGAGTGLAGNLAPFVVSVTYTASAVSDARSAGAAAEIFFVHDITASAVFGTAGTPDFVERVINAKI